jgi:hypothetical protein
MKRMVTVIFLVGFIFILKNVETSKNEKKPNVSKLQKRIFRKIASTKGFSSIGKIYFCKGTFFINRIEEKCNGKMNKEIYESDLIETDIRSFVKLKMVDETNIMLGPKSKFDIEEYSVVNKNEKNITISLIKGFLHTHFREKVKKGKAIIKTRNASMGVRGTEFITEFDGSKTRVFLFHGLVSVTSIDKKNDDYLIKPNELVEIDDFFKVEKSKLNNQWVDELEEKFEKEEFVPKLKGNFIKYKVVYSEIKKPTTSYDVKGKSFIDRSNDEIIEKIVNSKSKNKKDIQTYLNKSYSENKGRIVLNLDNSEKSEKLKSKLKEFSKEKLTNRSDYVADLNKRGVVYPLIKPNNEVVYFEDNPDALKNIPRDKNGDIIGIRVDEDLNPIQTEALLIEDDLNTPSIEKIRVVGEDGSIEALEIVTEDNRLITLPDLDVSDQSLVVNEEGEFQTLDNKKNGQNETTRNDLEEKDSSLLDVVETTVMETTDVLNNETSETSSIIDDTLDTNVNSLLGR